ncbi:RNA polymerase sigma factor [Pedobacter frigoris]|uniref:RNA polymerase sigma factor n=1 Tax=Pedobacter frigoris TaxID=2571272 RepID=UPI00292DF1B5|nr:sigma-70 family RNA polymerase sigma factor [Pedobacter frigoris]
MVAYSVYSEQELIFLLKKKDELAFTEIYRRYWHMLYLHAFKILAEQDEAKDMVQDLFFAFWEKSAELDVKTNLKGYLYRGMRNRVLNAVRRNKTNSNFMDLIAAEMDELDNKTIETIDERQLMALIDAEVAQLSPKSREIFEMSRKEFLNNKEIAERLGMTEEAVKKQIQRSVKLLKLKLSDYAGLSVLLISILEQKK